jgi:hypothetical protein
MNCREGSFCLFEKRLGAFDTGYNRVVLRKGRIQRLPEYRLFFEQKPRVSRCFIDDGELLWIGDSLPEYFGVPMQRRQCRQSIVDPFTFTCVALLLPAGSLVLCRYSVLGQGADSGQPCPGVTDLLDPFERSLIDQRAARIRSAFASRTLLCSPRER